MLTISSENLFETEPKGIFIAPKNGVYFFQFHALTEPGQPVKAQMVVYEAEKTGVSSGWFYWTLKTEGGAFAEWNFLLGARQGWIPDLPEDNTVSAESLYGTCEKIAENTNDNEYCAGKVKQFNGRNDYR